MKNFYLCLLFAGYSLMVKAQADTLTYRKLANAVQKQFAPDKRSVYFNVQIKADTLWVESNLAVALQELSKLGAAFKNLKVISTLLPTKNLNGLEYGITNLSVGNNRSSPQNSAELLTQTILGTPVQVLKKQGGFYLVKTPDGYLSWTDGTAIGLMNLQQFTAWQKANKVIFVSDFGHAFSKADIKSARVSDLVAGNILQLLSFEKEFYKVSYPDGRIGFIPKKDAIQYQNWLKQQSPTPASILASAQTLIGVPYLWGGTSVKGVDCSGFTKTAYFLNGILIPRDASQQALVGQKIDVLEKDTISIAKCLTNLQPGDLLFFAAAKRKGINNGRVTHTAIYMDNGQFIQAAGMVKISSLLPNDVNYDEWQTSTLVGARRILNQVGTPEIISLSKHPWY